MFASQLHTGPELAELLSDGKDSVDGEEVWIVLRLSASADSDNNTERIGPTSSDIMSFHISTR